MKKEHLRKKLTPLQFAVVCEAATEPPFRNAYWDHHEAGLYVDVVSGQPLFASVHKFDSGSGWPSFTRPVETGSVLEVPDESHGMIRVEVRSQVGSHLGHVFPDGPISEGGQRYCINSASLRFVPLADLVKENLSQYASLFGLETIDFAGGCFWGLQELLRSFTGVVATAVGYAGAELPNPSYEHHAGHAETVRVLFDPKKVSLDTLLVFFFSIHDPTTENRQGNDVGTSYRSAIFVQSDAQAAVAKQVIARIDGAKAWQGRKIVTQVQKAGPFWLAEDYHQDYLQKNPGGYSCHYKRDIS